MRSKSKIALFGACSSLVILLGVPNVFAADDAHQHGVGSLNIAFEGKEVEIELELPADDVVGFEHAPSSDEDRKKIKDAVARLNNAASLFSFSSAANCHPEKTKIESSLIKASTEMSHDDHADEKKHDHADEEKHDHADEEKHDEDGHAEFAAHFHFECQNINKLTSIEAKVFTFFPSVEKLQVQYLTTKGQGAATITPKDNRLNF